MKILYLTQTFPPEPGPTKRPLKQAVVLKGLGHNVTILTTMPYYPHGVVHKAYRNKWIYRETMEGIDILRIWSLPASNQKKFCRILSYLSFSFLSMLVALLQPKYDLIIASVPNIGTEFAVVVAAKLKRSRALLELRDIIPDNLAFIGISESSLFYRLLRAYYGCVYRWVHWIALPGKNMIQTLVNRGVPSGKILYLPHAADIEIETPILSNNIRERYNLSNKFLVIYAGSFSKYHGIPNIIHAAQLLHDRWPNIHIMLIGTGPEWERANQLCREFTLENITLTGSIPPDEVSVYLQTADLFITSFIASNVPVSYRDYFRTKTAEYMMYGRPIIDVKKEPASDLRLEQIGVGICIQAEKPQVLAEEIIRYAEDREICKQQGLMAKKYALQYLDRRKVVQRFMKELCKKMGYVVTN